MAAGGPVGILRLAKIVAPGMALFQQWRKTLAASQPIYPFRDMFIAPTRIGVTAAAITALLTEQCPGIWQLSGPEDVSYAEIAAHIGRSLRAEPNLVQPIAAASAGMPTGSTPRHTTLDSSFLRSAFGIASPEPWTTIEGVLNIPASASRTQ
jgi:dTDP-4-dehydrorhamnose reductase